MNEKSISDSNYLALIEDLKKAQEPTEIEDIDTTELDEKMANLERNMEAMEADFAAEEAYMESMEAEHEAARSDSVKNTSVPSTSEKPSEMDSRMAVDIAEMEEKERKFDEEMDEFAVEMDEEFKDMKQPRLDAVGLRVLVTEKKLIEGRDLSLSLIRI